MASNASALSGGEGDLGSEETIGSGEASGSASGSGSRNRTSTETVRAQAGPLPFKRGEIGYREDHQSQSQTPSTSTTLLPGRHPADHPPDASAPQAPSSRASDASSDGSSMNSMGKHSLISFSNLPKVGGVRLASLGILLLQLSAIGGTVAGWAVVAKRMPNNSSGPLGINSTLIFVHIAFAIITLLQIVFLERSIFRVRAERYAHKHPGGILPSSRNRLGNPGGMTLGIAPWSRPPLPNYAAALAQSGHGTGDVEDNIIAVPPPPAYGNTRGSTLLLSGFIGENLRAQRTRERVRESQGTVRGSWLSGLSRRSDRPVSYRSHDSAWEERVDAHRAIQLEETLARLEEGRESEPTSTSSRR
ncbi:unnamed protein product [Somion occarium]|uniref:Uncharacterized protein n=1 Tax=Somion occarium TaxID=3059160 RepID=A0ABP1DX82_9APHY